MAILRILVIVAILLAIVDLSEMKKHSHKGSAKPISNRTEKRGLVLEERDRVNGLNSSLSYKNTTNGPTLIADRISLKEGASTFCLDVLKNDGDHDTRIANDSLVIYTQAKHGVATVKKQSNGKLFACYLPNEEFHGSDSFEYSACDTDGNCDSAVVRIQVSSVNDAPTARDDFATVGEDEYSVTIPVLRNDEDIDGAYVNFSSLQVVQKPCHGIATVNDEHKIVYVPNWNDDTRFFGTDSFIYQVCDSEDPNLCSHTTVSVDVKDKCIACERCNDLMQTFNDQAAVIQQVFVDTIIHDL